jgi:ribosomal protein S18 acetylase RimI-like enzyme
MHIAPISEADLPQLALLYQQLIPNQYSLDKLRHAFLKNQESGNPIVLGAKIDGNLVGTLLAVRAQMLFGACHSFIVIEDVVVNDAYRRKGVGTALMQYIEQYAQRNDCSYIMLVTDQDRVDSQEFYQALGYRSQEYCAFKKHLNLEDRVPRGNRQKYDRVLGKVKDVPPDPGDEL